MKMTEGKDALRALAESADIEADIGSLAPLAPESFDPDGEDEFVAFGPTGHGFASWRFRLRLKTSFLDFDFGVPCWLALADEDVRRGRAEDVRSVCKLSVAAMSIVGKGWPEGRRLVARYEPEDGCLWWIEDADGASVRSGEGWVSLADLLVGLVDSPSGGTEPLVWTMA